MTHSRASRPTSPLSVGRKVNLVSPLQRGLCVRNRVSVRVGHMGTDAESTREDLVLRVAKTLQGSFAKQVTGTPRKWRDVPPDEKKAWVRLARMADKMLSDADGSNRTPAPPASSVLMADPEPALAAAAPHSPASSPKGKSVAPPAAAASHSSSPKEKSVAPPAAAASNSPSSKAKSVAPSAVAMADSAKEKPVSAATISPQEKASKASHSSGWASLLGGRFVGTKTK
jgi:hypothetical protein